MPIAIPRTLVLGTRVLSRLPGVRRQSTKTTDTDKFKKSFRGQLYDSTAQRIQNERAALVNAKLRSGSSGGGQTGSEKVSGGTLAGIFAVAIVFYYLGSLSVPAPPTNSTSPLKNFPSPKHDLSKLNLEASWTEFVALLGAEHVSTAEEDLTRHSTSEWSSHHGGKRTPFLIVYPSTTEEVSRIAKICHQRRIPMTAFSGGTSLEGHFTPTRGGVCVDFSRMDKILRLHKEDLDVVVQPALGWEHLNDVLAEDGLFFPPDPGPGAQIGGMVGTGCSGTNAAKYGTMREWVLSLTVVLADGTVIKTRQRPRKSSAGYDLTRMFIGSEGTLGFVTEATLKLAVKPASESVAVSSFPTIRDAAETVAEVMAKGIPIAAIEILDDVQMKCINQSGSTSRSWKEEPTLFFKFAGTQSGVKEQIALVKQIGKSHRSQSFEFARNSDEAHELWSARKEALWSVMALRRDENDHVWTTDVAVPLSRLAEIIEATKSDLKSSGLLGSMVGHVGDGNFHCILLFNKSEQEVADGVVHRMIERAVGMEGTVTGEHGVGLVKRDYLEGELGKDTVDAMRRLKLAFDPLCLLNCDKVVRVEPKKKLK
ncbi:FAD-binding domain-containing protein [Choiromyces venosus 120613-1]|uniref:D-lactate dehydrogenase (cytochrome) n=1 Tax=Choiromyces venosus 120613-1 TaxID=1336337 RepID=A0A3N4K7C5_9PEZI|nr:FAD-binding domain-containing protein [Choiromyces venosus 120613-1]